MSSANSLKSTALSPSVTAAKNSVTLNELNTDVDMTTVSPFSSDSHVFFDVTFV